MIIFASSLRQKAMFDLMKLNNISKNKSLENIIKYTNIEMKEVSLKSWSYLSHILKKDYDYDLSLDKGAYGDSILPEGKVLMEVKTATAIPLWMVEFLSKYKIYKTSFSKYGTAYALKMKG